MKRKWTGILTVLVAMMILASTAVPAFAQSEALSAEANPQPILKRALAIKAPRIAPPGEEITITVYERRTHEPVAAAAVWALTRDNAKALQQEIAELRPNTETIDEEQDYEARVRSLGGIWLGTTNEDGNVRHTFNQTGKYLLIALKNGHIPGIAPLAVKVHPKGLIIRAPRVAQPDTEVTMAVCERQTHDPVAGAGIWALSREKAEELQTEMSKIREDAAIDAEEYDYEALINIHGEFLGKTGEDGKLTHTFNKEGKYLLVTFKKGYRPGFAPLVIKTQPKALVLRAPRLAQPNKEITMNVYERPAQNATGEVAPIPVAGADIWAVPEEKAEEIRAQAAEADDYRSVLEKCCMWLGETDNEGKLNYTFKVEGKYFLVTTKDGYRPGFRHLTVKNVKKGLKIRAPRMAQPNEDITMAVYERPFPNVVEETAPVPVSDAHVWALSRDNTDVLKNEIAEFKERSEISAEEYDYESRVRGLGGIYLGMTDVEGKLTFSLEKEDKYLLIALNKNYWPGFAPLTIKTKPDVLAIKAPRRAMVGEEVTMNVVARRTNQPVEEAGIWALSRDNAKELRANMTEMKAQGSVAATAQDFESMMNIYGELLGTTDENGKLNHTFVEAGWKLLLTAKQGCWPGFAPMMVRTHKTVGPMTLDESAQ